MYNNEEVCMCMNVTVQDLKDAIENGAKSFEEVQEVTGVSTGCGNCEDRVRTIVQKLLEEQ